MPIMRLLLIPAPDADTAAAIIAAVSCAIEQEQADRAPNPPVRPAWAAAAALAAQGVPPARNSAYATWHAVERARHEDRWSFGIVGL